MTKAQTGITVLIMSGISGSGKSTFLTYFSRGKNYANHR
jgi:ABC-type lipoprotein export system ATPase subunit